MNQDMFINRLAQLSGKSRKQVIEDLRKICRDPKVQKRAMNFKAKAKP